MAPIVTLMRHAQGWHDYFQDWSITDPILTEQGVRQCLVVQNQFRHHDKITHILASPLFRTIQTAVSSFKPALERGIQVQPMPEVTANAPDGCNQGHTPERIIQWTRSNLGGDYLDERMFRLMPSDWYDKSAGLYEYQESKLKLRASIARQIIRRMAINASDDAHIVVVTHWEFLPYLTQEVGPMWKNAEWRTYTIGLDDAAALKPISL